MHITIAAGIRIHSNARYGPAEVCQILLIIGAIGYLLELLYHGLFTAAYPYEVNYSEGYVLNDALRLVRGQPVWTDLADFPMVRSPYPPLYLLLSGFLALPHPALLGPRLLSLSSALAIAVLVGYSARRTRVPWYVVGATVAVWLGSTFVYQWAPLVRVDLLGLLLSVAAVVAVLPGASNRRLAVAAACCALSLLTKQTYLAAPIAIFLSLAWQRDRRALWFGLGVAAPVVLATGILGSITQGAYVRQVVLGNVFNDFHADRILDWGVLFLRINLVALLLAIWGVGRRRQGDSAISWYLPLALLSLVTIGNVSGDVNYLLEPTAAIALALPFAWQVVPISRQSTILGLLVLQLALLLHVPNGLMSQVPPGPAKGATPTAEDTRVGAEVEAILRAAGGRALVEPAAFSVLIGQPVWIQPLDLQGEERLGRWRPDRLVQSIDQQEWSVVVLDYKFLPGAAMDALERAYSLDRGLGSPNGLSYFIYRPRSFQETGQLPPA